MKRSEFIQAGRRLRTRLYFAQGAPSRVLSLCDIALGSRGVQNIIWRFLFSCYLLLHNTARSRCLDGGERV